jgi:uncharacterized protein YneR
MYLKQNIKGGIGVITLLLTVLILGTSVNAITDTNSLQYMEEKPVIQLTSSDGEIMETCVPTDSIIANIWGLLPDTEYRLQIIKPGGKVLSATSYMSDKCGIIPNISFEQDFENPFGSIELEEGENEIFYCILKRENNILHTFPIRFMSEEDKEENAKVNSDDSDLLLMNDEYWDHENIHLQTRLACQVPSLDRDGETVIGNLAPIYKNYFAGNEEVWVAVEPVIKHQDYSYQTARLYVVNRKGRFAWREGTHLVDVSGGFETLSIKPGNASLNYARVWKNPIPCEDGYDVIVDFEPFGIYNKGQDILHRIGKRGLEVPENWISLESISFNHDARTTDSDAINVRMNNIEDVHVPEWKKAELAYPAVYLKNSSITVKAVFHAAPGVREAKIGAFVKKGRLGRILHKTIHFTNGTSGTVSFKVIGVTPKRIRDFVQMWNWYIKDINGESSNYTYINGSANKVFILLQHPQLPWTTSGQTETWVEVIEKASWWASGEKNVVGAATKISKHLFINAGGLYDTDWGMPFYPYSFDFTTFDVTNFLANLPNVGLVNCYDMGKSLVTFSNSIGCGLSYTYTEPFGYLNCINAIGRGWTNNPFFTNPDPQYNFSREPIVPGDWSWDEGRSWFGNHAFGTMNGIVFDACLTVDTDNNPDDGPFFKETWMINIQWEDYRNKVIDAFPIPNRGFIGDPEIRLFEIF